MRTPPRRPRPALLVEALETRDLPSVAPTPAGVLWQQSFDHTAPGALPSGWSQWSSQPAVAASEFAGNHQTAGLQATGDAGQTARAWANAAQPADVRATADVFVGSPVAGQVFVRGSNLGTSAPSYYSVSVTRGLDVQLLRTVNGVAHTLAKVQSSSFLSNQWLTVSLRASGSSFQAFVRRQDTGQYLTPAGKWQAGAVAALSVGDSAIRGGGQAGLARAPGASGDVLFDNFTVTAPDGTAALVRQDFNGMESGLPAGWSQWSSEGSFGASPARGAGATGGLTANAGSGVSALAWANAPAPADAQVSAAVFLNSLAPAEVFLRGTGLGTAAPSYYAVAVTRGVDVSILRVSRGHATALGDVESNDYLSDRWAQVTLQASGHNLMAMVQRLDTRQYLTADGSWQASPAAALTVQDAALSGPGLAGVGKGPDYAGSVAFDNVALSGTTAAPLAVSITGVSPGALLSRPAVVQARLSNARHPQRVEFYLDGQLQATDIRAPWSWSLNPDLVSDGTHTLTVLAYDQGGASARASLNVTTSSAGLAQSVKIPQHYPWIRLAELAYGGTTLGAFEQQLLRNSIDLLIPNTSLLPSLNDLVPNTPQLLYTNVSSLYSTLLTDWLSWADAHHVSRESAFYHATAPTRFSGNSGSAMPVSWFWAVYAGGAQAGFTDFTNAAHAPDSREVPFGGAGTSIYIGYPDKFREMNFHLGSGARDGWAAVLEYPTAVDANGNPTAWATLKTLTNTTAGLARSGQVTFDPPANWVTASFNGSARMYYVRVRTVSDGTPPVAETILGRDYTNSHGGWSGTVPVFDYAADRNHDGYLNNAEYAVALAHHDTARFAYESRVFGVYGPMRPWTNPSSPAFRSWAVDYDVRLLKSQPLADGLFVDNSSGKATVDDASVVEPVDTYATDYGAMLNAVGRAIAPRWIMANTSGGQDVSDAVISQNTGYFEEFALRPLSGDWTQFESLGTLIQHRQSLRNPTPYAVLDSLPTGGSPTDPRTQLATLAEYYLLADPKNTFLDFFGGYEPATSWTRHWSPAAAFNVGRPIDGWSVFASGTDPGNRALNYRVYQRPYTNALVLYKPLSHSQGVSRNGALASNTATSFRLDGRYRPLRADGTLGSVVTSVSLRNGEGAILVKVSGT